MRLLIALLFSLTLFAQNNVDRAKIYADNLLYNGGFELNYQGWSTANIGAGAAAIVTGANAAFGNKAMSVDFSAASQYVESTAVSVPVGLRVNSCEANFYTKGWSSGDTFAIYDGTSGAVSGATLTLPAADSDFRERSIYFICPTQGQVKLRVTSLGNDTIGYIDQVYLGRKVTTSKTTIQTITSGSGTYTKPTGVSWIRVRMAGGGGGGGGSGTATTATDGTDGGDTTFGFMTSGGGKKGYKTNSNAGSGGVGGTATLGSSGAIGFALSGTQGGAAFYTLDASQYPGTSGGATPFLNGAGIGLWSGSAPHAPANGGGGGGSGMIAAAGTYTGSGGGSGGYIDAVIKNPLNSYSYSIGAGGTGGNSGTNGYPGGNGGSGVIYVEENY